MGLGFGEFRVQDSGFREFGEFRVQGLRLEFGHARVWPFTLLGFGFRVLGLGLPEFRAQGLEGLGLRSFILQ